MVSLWYPYGIPIFDSYFLNQNKKGRSLTPYGVREGRQKGDPFTVYLFFKHA